MGKIIKLIKILRNKKSLISRAALKKARDYFVVSRVALKKSRDYFVNEKKDEARRLILNGLDNNWDLRILWISLKKCRLSLKKPNTFCISYTNQI